MPSFKPRNTARARALRHAASPAERLLWRYLSGSQLGAKFSRQMPIGPYFADFLCRDLQLVIELDGTSHDTRLDHDDRRNHWMYQQGLTILRFTNADALQNPEGVVTRIAETVARLKSRPGPLPPAGWEY